MTQPEGYIPAPRKHSTNQTKIPPGQGLWYGSLEVITNLGELSGKHVEVTQNTISKSQLLRH